MVTAQLRPAGRIAPLAIGEWYLAVYLDAFASVVELPNTQAMVMHADGGYLASKPYCASGSTSVASPTTARAATIKSRKRWARRACPFNALYWHFLIAPSRAFRPTIRACSISIAISIARPERQQALWQRGETCWRVSTRRIPMIEGRSAHQGLSGLPAAFAWRKKWERNLDEVRYCSERCRRQRSSLGGESTSWMC